MNAETKTGLGKANEISHRLTTEAIQQALFILMGSKSFEEITVTDIIRRSGVSRAAFYKNYRSKNDVVNDRLGQLLSEAYTVMDYTGSIREKAIYIYNVINENRAMLKLLLDSGLERQLLDKANSLAITDNMTFNQKMYMTLWNGAIFNFFTQMIRDDSFGSLKDLLSFVDYISMRVQLPENII